MSLRRMGTLLAVLALLAGVGTFGVWAQNSDNEIRAAGEEQSAARVSRVGAQVNITGTVKVQVVVSPNGTVKEAKVVGGHPVLAGAALEAVRKWRFEPAPGESTGVVDFSSNLINSRQRAAGGNGMTIGKKLYVNFGIILSMVVVLFIVNLLAVHRDTTPRMPPALH